MRKRWGEVIVEKVEYEGVTYPIKLIKADGIFYCYVGEKRIYSGDLITMKRELMKTLKEYGSSLKWEPVIYIESVGYYNRQNEIRIRRCFRARSNDEWHYRNFECGSEKMGSPVSYSGLDEKHVIPYTLKRWKNLRAITDDGIMDTINEKIFKAFYEASLNQVIRNADTVTGIEVTLKKGKK